MVSIDTARVATCFVAAALAGASAAAFPSVARADESPDPAASLPMPDVPTTSDVGAVLGADSDDALADELAGALDSVGVVDDAPAESLAPEPVPVTEASVPASAASADAAPSTGSAPEQMTNQSGDITSNAADTTGDTASGSGSASSPASTLGSTAAVQSAPSNVNVSVRVESPGDNGAVTQVNIAASAGIGAGDGALPSSPARASVPAPTSSSQTAGAGQQTTTISPAGSGSDPATGTWTWEWDCLSVPPFTAISPSSSTTGSVPSNWSWIWNCGDNTVQYHGGTIGQYQPVNLNVAIRISSPGNDGPVTQSNIAIGVSSGRSSPDGHVPEASPSPPSSVGSVAFPGIASLPSIASLPGLPSLPAVLSPFVSAPPSQVEGGDVSDVVFGPELSLVEGPVELPLVLPGLGGAGATWLTGPGLVRRGAIADLRRGVWVPGIVPRLVSGPLGAAARSSSIDTGASSSNASDSRTHAKPAPRWRTPVPRSPASESAPLGASAAAATAGGSSSGGLPLFLALPFLVALLDLARRVVLDRAASPSEHRSRMPDNPG
jgi:hypothetical protein